MEFRKNLTERANKMLSTASKTAMQMNSEFVGTEHILLAMLEDKAHVAARVLKAFGITDEAVRAAVNKLITPSSSPTVTLGHTPYSPRAKRVVELAEEAAAQLGQDVIGTEHMLLGILREKEGIAAQVLMELGMTLEKGRDAILEMLGTEMPPAPPKGENEKTVDDLAWRLAKRLHPELNLSHGYLHNAFKAGAEHGAKTERDEILKFLVANEKKPITELVEMIKMRGRGA